MVWWQVQVETPTTSPLPGLPILPQTNTLRARRYAFHLSPWSVWAHARTVGSVVPERFATEGFVHLTLGLDQLLVPANAYYRGDPRPHVALTVDLAAVTDEVRFDADPPIYPHLYGPLPVAAVTEVRAARRDPDGTFTGWDPPIAP